MGYLFLGCALLAGMTKGFCGKKTSSFVSAYKDAAFSNMIRMFLCIIFGLGLVLWQSGAGSLVIDGKTILISVMSGIFTSMFVVTWLIVVKKGAYMMVDVFMTVGMIIPLIFCKIFYDEAITKNHIIGVLILFAAVYIMCSYNNSIKEKIDIRKFGLLVLLGFSSGMSDFSQKLFVYEIQGGNATVFNFYTYVVSFLCLGIFYLTVKLSEKEKNEETGSEKKLFKSIWGYILVMSVCLFLNSYFKTLAAGLIPSAQLYPINQGAALILATLMARVFFKERINMKCIIGIVLAFTALIIINL